MSEREGRAWAGGGGGGGGGSGGGGGGHGRRWSDDGFNSELNLACWRGCSRLDCIGPTLRLPVTAVAAVARNRRVLRCM